MGMHPLCEIVYVCDGVDDAAWTEDVGVFCEEGWGDDACFVFAELEVRVWEEEEEGAEGGFWEVVWEEFHSIRADNRDILVGVASRGRRGRSGVGGTEGSDAVLDILGDLDAYFE